MRRFGWRSAAQEEEPQDDNVVDTSPARSYRSTNSSRGGGGGGSKAIIRSREESPSKPAGGAAAGDVGALAGAVVSAGVPMSNKKTLKIGANVRFRGDVMECNTVVLCGRLQVFAYTTSILQYSYEVCFCVCFIGHRNSQMLLWPAHRESCDDDAQHGYCCLYRFLFWRLHARAGNI